MDQDNRVCIMGMGYVGLTLGAVMANRGFEVHGIEINQATLDVITQGKAHFHEANLDALIRRGINRGSLKFHREIPVGVEFDIYIITVGTPLDALGSPRMDMVEQVTKEICATMKDDSLIILRSTVRIGTCENVVRPYLEATGKRFHLCFCPERTVEGKAIEELVNLPQIVGGMDEESTARAMSLFRRLTPTIVKVSSTMAAELIKLLDNSFRDLFFAFGNEVAFLCEALGVSGREVIQAANMGYTRTNIAKPGFVGGPCLEKDPHILIDSLAPYQFMPQLISHGRRINETMIDHVFESVRNAVGSIANPVISLMGLAFKGRPNTDDLRGSLALKMIQKIRKEIPGAILLGQDYVCSAVQIESTGVKAVDDIEAFRNVDVVVIMNNHPRYNALDIEHRSTLLKRPSLIYDCWNVFEMSPDLPQGVTLHVFGN